MAASMNWGSFKRGLRARLKDPINVRIPAKLEDSCRFYILGPRRGDSRSPSKPASYIYIYTYTCTCVCIYTYYVHIIQSKGYIKSEAT